MEGVAQLRTKGVGRCKARGPEVDARGRARRFDLLGTGGAQTAGGKDATTDRKNLHKTY